MHFKSDVGAAFLGKKMKKKKISIVLISFLAYFLCDDEFIYEIKTPRIHNKEVENIQTSLSKVKLLSENDIDGWYGPITEKAVKEIQKIIGIKDTGKVNPELYQFLTNDKFFEIIKLDKIEKYELFEKVLDCSGYIFEVYYENTEIKKITKRYWVANAPDYNREEQFSQTIYYLNNQYVQKWIQNSDAKWNFNLEEKEGKSLKQTINKLKE